MIVTREYGMLPKISSELPENVYTVLVNRYIIESVDHRVGRRLEAIIKMQKDFEGKLHELMQQMKRLGGCNCVQR